MAFIKYDVANLIILGHQPLGLRVCVFYRCMVRRIDEAICFDISLIQISRTFRGDEKRLLLWSNVTKCSINILKQREMRRRIMPKVMWRDIYIDFTTHNLILIPNLPLL